MNWTSPQLSKSNAKRKPKRELKEAQTLVFIPFLYPFSWHYPCHQHVTMWCPDDVMCSNLHCHIIIWCSDDVMPFLVQNPCACILALEWQFLTWSMSAGVSTLGMLTQQLIATPSACYDIYVTLQSYWLQEMHPSINNYAHTHIMDTKSKFMLYLHINKQNMCQYVHWCAYVDQNAFKYIFIHVQYYKCINLHIINSYTKDIDEIEPWK